LGQGRDLAILTSLSIGPSTWRIAKIASLTPVLWVQAEGEIDEIERVADPV